MKVCIRLAYRNNGWIIAGIVRIEMQVTQSSETSIAPQQTREKTNICNTLRVSASYRPRKYLTHTELATTSGRPRNTGLAAGVLENGVLGPSLASG